MAREEKAAARQEKQEKKAQEAEISAAIVGHEDTKDVSGKKVDPSSPKKSERADV